MSHAQSYDSDLGPLVVQVVYLNLRPDSHNQVRGHLLRHLHRRRLDILLLEGL